MAAQTFWNIPLRTDANGAFLVRVPLNGAIDRIRGVLTAAGGGSLELTISDPDGFGEEYATQTGAGTVNADLETVTGSRYPVFTGRSLYIRGTGGNANVDCGYVLIQLVGG